MKISPHCHPESPLTGSTLVSLIKRARELKRTHFCYTDHGHMSSALKAYGIAKKAGLKFIPGVELYFKDSNCPITTGTKASRAKYFTITVYCSNQASFQGLAQIVSRTDLPSVEIYEDKWPLMGWKELSELAALDTQIVLSGVHCIVGKTMLAGESDLAICVFEKLLGRFGPNRLSVAIMAEPWQKRWHSVIEIEYDDGTKDSVMASDRITTDKARNIRAIDLIERSGHKILKNKLVGLMSHDINKAIKDIKLHKGYLPLPGGDASLKVNQFLTSLAQTYGVKTLVTDYAYYAHKDDKIVQTMRLETTRLHPNLHMKSGEEVLNYLTTTMGLSVSESEKIIQNNEEWAKNFDGFALTYEWRLAESEDGSLKKMMEIIRANGRMRWEDPVWISRLKEELDVIVKNPKKNLLPYFFPIVDILQHYKENGSLTGPARGSAGGSLLAYLMGITNVDPIKYKLSFSRFFSLDRIMNDKLPDIDTDLESRDLLVGENGKSGYLYGRWGNRAAQISTRTTMRLKSSIKDTNRYLKGKVEPEIETFTKGLPQPPQGVSDKDYVFGYDNEEGDHVPGLIEQNEDLQRYAKERPIEWEIVKKSLGITRAYSKHASAFVLSDIPIKDIVPTKEGNITQYEAKEAEAAGLIKYDLLVINQLKDIRLCLDLINKKNNEQHTVGYFSNNGQKLYVWDLPEVPEAFKSVWGGSTETCFQINTKSMIPFVKDILPQSIEDLATILALVRPGPLDYIDPNTGRNMAQEYVQRRQGLGADDLPILKKMLPETYAVIVYQEQLVRIARELGGFDGAEAEKFRENAAKKKQVELQKQKGPFVEGASRFVTREEASALWERMETFARYSFNCAHATAYAMITYSCVFLKHFYPLEWWAAVLTNASEQEITSIFWPYVKEMILPPDINLSGDTMVVDYNKQKIRSKLGVIRGMGEASIDPIVSNRPYRDIQHFVDLDVAGKSLTYKLIHVGVLDSLFPPSANLIEKLTMYENAVEIKKFQDKVQKANSEGRNIRQLEPKQGLVEEAYLTIEKFPFQDAAMKKSVLPSLNVNLHAIAKQHSKVLKKKASSPIVISNRGYDTLLLTGEQMRRLDALPGESISEDRYVAATCFVVKVEEFSYPKAKPTKRALKIVLDADGYVSEKVLWPDYDTGQLIYPPDLKKNCIATVFFRKKTGRKDMIITSVVVET